MKIKNFFIFIFFFLFLVFVVSANSWEVIEYDPCRSDSWVLYENEYKDTIIVHDPYQ
jgi:hypothetical protein